MARKRKPLAERVTWIIHPTNDWIQELWHCDEHIRLIKNTSGCWEVFWRSSGRKRFRMAGGWEPAKAEALRIVQAAVLAAAESWSD